MKVFVYGTVMPGGKYHDYICRSTVSSFQKAKVKGKLYDLKVGYPGILLGGENWVRGYLLIFKNKYVLKKLDILEGFDEKNIQEANEYSRTRISIFDLKEKFIGKAWVYFMKKEQLSRFDYSFIASGEWKN